MSKSCARQNIFLTFSHQLRYEILENSSHNQLITCYNKHNNVSSLPGGLTLEVLAVV